MIEQFLFQLELRVPDKIWIRIYLRFTQNWPSQRQLVGAGWQFCWVSNQRPPQPHGILAVNGTSNCKVSWTTKFYRLPVLGCLIMRLMCFVPFAIKCVLKLCGLVVQTRIGHSITRLHKDHACAYIKSFISRLDISEYYN